MYKILTLNNISQIGLDKLPSDSYAVSDNETNPDAIILRSFKMHEMDIPPALKAVGRAGSGVNNIPLDKMSAAGIPVFNAPGANANAVKELVIASLFMAARNISEAIKYTEGLSGEDAEVTKLVEAGKKKLTIGVIGLGAIGRIVANTCINLGMKVVGFDPGLTVDGAWHVSSEIKRANSVDEILAMPKISVK